MSLDLEDRLTDAFDRVAARTVVEPLPPLARRRPFHRRVLLVRTAAVVVLAGGAIAGVAVSQRGSSPSESVQTVEPMPAIPPLFDQPAGAVEWTVVDPGGTIAQAQIGSMVAGPGGFVAAGMGFESMNDGQGRVWFSPDGEAWEPVAYDLFREQGVEVTATSDAYYVLATPEQDEGDPPAVARSLYRSFDGRTWELIGNPSVRLGTVTAVGDRLVQLGLTGTSVVSSDGVDWQPMTFESDVDSVLPYPPRFAALDGTYYTSTVSSDWTRQRFWQSADSISWTSIPAPSKPGFPLATSSGLAALVVANGDDCTAPADATMEEALDVQRSCRLRLHVEHWTPGDPSWTVIGQVVVPTATWPRMWSFADQLVAAIVRPDGGLSVWTSADGAAWDNPLNVEPMPESGAWGSPDPFWAAAQNETTIVIPISSTGAGVDPARLVVGHIVEE